jgi:amino acid transporter
MIAYTGIETVSNLAEARDPQDDPRSVGLVAVAVFIIYSAPLVAAALPVERLAVS